MELNPRRFNTYVQKSSYVAGFLSLLFAQIPGGQGPALGAAIIGSGAGVLAQLLKAKDKGKGITVNLMWTGYSISTNYN
ncbi:hypothetical protein [Paenibacillus polymyxa]|uniref:hypothetical protein n=2 Tax=Paenibacillus TaxID=44249 RepID=UPI0008462397|nr:hypothetical protein [Paenibacillus polymyxa]AOK88505.1 hypothetical protein AOU00_01140 [Paenibacillus polymyxa]